MKALLKTLVPVSLFVLGACAPKTDVSKTTAQIDEIAARAKKNAQAASDAVGKVLALGGQPGQISLSGAFLASGAIDSRITLVSEAGFGRDGQRAERNASNVRLHVQVSPAASLSYAALANDASYINIGCDETTISASGLKRIDADLSQVVLMMRAHTIFVCGHPDFKQSMVFIDSSNLVLRDASIERLGNVASFLTVNSEVLSLEGENKMVSRGIDTVLAGATLDLSAARIEGSGRLAVSAFGANYQGK